MTEEIKTEEPAPAKKYPIINSHAHIFTGDHVPPYLAKSIVIAPFYKWVNFRRIFKIMRRHYRKKDTERFDGTANVKARRNFEWDRKFKNNYIRFALHNAAGWYLTLQIIELICHRIFTISKTDPCWTERQLISLHSFLSDYYLLLHPTRWWVQGLMLIAVIGFFQSGRNLLWFIAKNTISVLRKLPGKQTKQLIERYLTIGRFAFHEEQSRTLSDLKDQYPENSGFVILPMDMEYMDAGKPPKSYKEQMQELAEIQASKENIYPFVFVDPRRIAAEGPGYFNYEVKDGKVKLLPCFIKDYIEGHTIKKEIKKGKEKGKEKEVDVPKFSGFKIYPALGYYPFDPLLLPLWKYAEQENLPILTHCVRGPMYYRGKKERDWDYHPVFQELVTIVKKEDRKKISTDSFANMLLPQTKNDEFCANFTHPMNFLCLLKKEFLAKAVEIAISKARDEQTKDNLRIIFGFTPAAEGNSAVVSRGLDDLKICFGHYGGGDEWLRYFEKDRFKHSAQLAKKPDKGIDFINQANDPTTKAPGKAEQLWKFTDWYSIISSMMLQHDNVYADISYILHADAEILPLLKQTLQNKKLRSKVLYGTDFFVVRNHKSDKNMLADMMGGLDVEDFDQIARCNPRKFLNLAPQPEYSGCY